MKLAIYAKFIYVKFNGDKIPKKHQNQNMIYYIDQNLLQLYPIL